jgi:hypothetical protein
MKFLTSGQMCKYLGIDMATIHKWCVAEIITPVAGGTGQGSHRVFSVIDALSVACGRGMRSQGYTLAAAGAVMRVIKGLSEERLLAAFEEGNTCIAFLGDHVFPTLVNEQDARGAGEAFLADNAEMFDRTGLYPQALDVERVYRNIIRLIEAAEKEQATV